MTPEEWVVELKRRYREKKILWTEECLQLAVDLELSLERNRDRHHSIEKTTLGLDPSEPTLGREG